MDGRCTDVDRFAFRGIVRPPGASKHTWNNKRQDCLEMDTVQPIQRSSYKKYLHRFKWALTECCNFTAGALAEMGMHSLRVGGDTWLFENKMPAAVRQRMGGWAHAFSETTYIRTLVAERLAVCKAMGV